MNRLTPDSMESACRQFLLTLSVATVINQRQFDEWCSNFRDELEDAFINSGEPDECKGVWFREVFVAHRLSKSQLAPVIPAESCASHSVAEPAGTFRSHIPQMLRRLWRKPR